MKKYQRLTEYFKKVLNFQGYNIYDTDHSIERYNERVGKDIFLYNKLLKKGINWLIKNNKTNIEDRYIWVSKKYGFGIQVHWRLDRDPKQGFHGFTATTLSNDEMKYYTKDDKEIFLEQLQKRGISLKESNLICEKGYYRYITEKDLKKEIDLIGLDLYIQSGNIYKNYEVVGL